MNPPKEPTDADFQKAAETLTEADLYKCAVHFHTTANLLECNELVAKLNIEIYPLVASSIEELTLHLQEATVKFLELKSTKYYQKVEVPPDYDFNSPIVNTNKVH